MRHARKAVPVTTATLLAGMLAMAGVPAAQAIDSTGGTPASAGTTEAQTVSAPTAAGGGEQAGSASTTGSGGAIAPSAQGTGGSQYGVLAPKAPVASKQASRKTSRASRHTHTATKPKTPPTKSKTPPVKPKAPPVKPKTPPAKPKAPPTKPTKPATPTPAKSIAGVPTPAQTVSEGAIFPVIGLHNFGDAANRFGAGRVGHIHEGQDVLASEGQEVVAPLAGTIITTAYQAGGAGWYAAEHTGDGLDFFYAHCQAGSLAVSTGDAVSAGQAICKVGQTGDATGPHLHFEVWVGGWQAKGGYPIDPLPYLEAWEET